MIKKVKLPDDASINASVDIDPIPQGFGIVVKPSAALTGLYRNVAQDLIGIAHQVCRYSNATRRNIEADVTAV
ncbi:hypothetical protein [Polynucleobacter sp. es-MAR-4]|uniref:hypothetical protein n=1 Tax=Polynucleobacter sp. es-MAR-4 TaxID=1855655 RepID=UPI001C0CE86E|nr:hypothetical protein [Polynucleobacter sp. es-MAR-4]MBU3637928.1 hypothetical protein [Polynucleobacter sp. es-MAR-4]